MACMEERERWSPGEEGGEVSWGHNELMLSTPESDSLSIRSDTPDLSSSARPDPSRSDRSERKGL